MERSLRHERADGHGALEDAVDRLPYPVIVTDDDGAVAFRNRAARRASVPTDLLAQAIDDATAKFAADGSRVAVRAVTAAARAELIAKTYRLFDRGCASVTIVFDRGGAAQSPRLPAWEVLTAREQEIAALVSKGLRTSEIATAAYISDNTVKQHLKRIYAKAGVRNRAELIQLIWSSTGGPD